MSQDIMRRAVAEFVGTFALIFVGAGSIVAVVGGPGAPGGRGSILLTIALAHGLVIAVMVSAVGHVSGGHFNPAVTIGAWVTQKIRGGDAVVYVLVQLVGGIAGAGLLRVALPEQLWISVSLGTPVLGVVSTGQAVLIEAVLTFFLVWVIFATAVDPEGTFGKIAGLAIGFTITFGVLMGGQFTSGAMNPARALGPALAGGYWADQWVYWVGPIAGGVIAAAAYDLLILRQRSPEPTLEKIP